MTASIIEHGQYVSSSGKPIAGGKLYIGTNGADPVATAPSTFIFSDRALTVSLANPQVLDSNGRSVNKIWVEGKYSIQVNSLVGQVETQEFQDLDAGTSAASESILAVSGIVGGDTITGTTDAAISSYTAGQQFVFAAASVNTGPVTLNIDGVGAKAIVKDVSLALVAADITANQEVIVIYNETNDNFDIVNLRSTLVSETNPKLGGPLDANGNMIQWSGASVASATELPLTKVANSFSVTGTTTIASIADLGSSGTIVVLTFSDSLTLTHSMTLELPGNADIQTSAGDVAIFQQKDATDWRCVSYSRDSGLPVTTIIKATARVNGAAGTFAKESGFASISRTGAGKWTVTLDDARDDVNYLVMLTLDQADTDPRDSISVNTSVTKTTTVFGVQNDNVTGTATDADFYVMVVDQ